jgi:hypothetical protein
MNAANQEEWTMKRVGFALAVCLAGALVASSVPKALVVMLDGVRGDVIENASAPNMQNLIAGEWQSGYRCASSMYARTVPDALASSAPNHAAIAVGVTTAKNCVTNTGAQLVQCDYAKWPSFLTRIAEERPGARTLHQGDDDRDWRRLCEGSRERIGA